MKVVLALVRGLVLADNACCTLLLAAVLRVVGGRMVAGHPRARKGGVVVGFVGGFTAFVILADEHRPTTSGDVLVLTVMALIDGFLVTAVGWVGFGVTTFVLEHSVVPLWAAVRRTWDRLWRWWEWRKAERQKKQDEADRLKRAEEQRLWALAHPLQPEPTVAEEKEKLDRVYAENVGLIKASKLDDEIKEALLAEERAVYEERFRNLLS